MTQLSLSPRAVSRISLAAVSLLVCGLALLLAGCASVKTVPQTTADAETLIRPPSAIYIARFDTSSGMWQGDLEPKEERERVNDWLIARLEKELRSIAPTEFLKDGAQPKAGWLITGRFLRVNPGSKAQRTIVGLGAGGSKMETKVDIYDLAVSSRQPILSFSTTGGSNLNFGPAALVSNALMGDIDRTAREIHDFVKEHVWSQPEGEVPSESVPESSLAPVEVDTREGRK